MKKKTLRTRPKNLLLFPLGKTKSTRQAINVLKKTKSHLIAAGRAVAVEIALEQGEVHSRQMRAKMDERGMLPKGQSEFWIGCIFRHSDFVDTGKRYKYSDSKRNIHERVINVWRLKAA